MTPAELMAAAGLAIAVYVAAMVFVFDVMARREDRPKDNDGREP